MAEVDAQGPNLVSRLAEPSAFYLTSYWHILSQTLEQWESDDVPWACAAVELVAKLWPSCGIGEIVGAMIKAVKSKVDFTETAMLCDDAGTLNLQLVRQTVLAVKEKSAVKLSDEESSLIYKTIQFCGMSQNAS
jgi:hypothetical protein